jgi:hypothetical protein
MQITELKSGFHLATGNACVTPVDEEGVFIPYYGILGDYMRDVQAFLRKYTDDPETCFPGAFAFRHTWEEVEEASRRVREQAKEMAEGQEHA